MLDGHTGLIDGIYEAVLPEGLEHRCIELPVVKIHIPRQHKECQFQGITDHGILVQAIGPIGGGAQQNNVIGCGDTLGARGGYLQVHTQ